MFRFQAENGSCIFRHLRDWHGRPYAMINAPKEGESHESVVSVALAVPVEDKQIDPTPVCPLSGEEFRERTLHPETNDFPQVGEVARKKVVIQNPKLL